MFCLSMLLACVPITSKGQNRGGAITNANLTEPGKNGNGEYDIPDWVPNGAQFDNCFSSWLDVELYHKAEYGGKKLKYKLVITNNSPYMVNFSFKCSSQSMGGRASARSGGSYSTVFSQTFQRGEKVVVDKINFSFPKDVQNEFGIPPLSGYLNCGENAESALNKAKGGSTASTNASNENDASGSNSSEDGDPLSAITNNIMNEGGFNSSLSRQRTQAQIHQDHVNKSRANASANSYGSSGSASGKTGSNTSRSNGGSSRSSRGMSPEEIERQRKAQEYALQKAKEELENRKRQEYARFKEEQNRKNAQAAAATAVGTVTALSVLGKMIYANMGVVDFDEVYQGQPAFSIATEFGYSFMVQPIFFNSIVFDGVDYEEQTNFDFAWPVNFDFNLKLGYEADYYGGHLFGGLGLGASIIMHSFNFPYHYGARVYAGHPNVKALFEYRRGGRSVSQNYWLLEEESGSASSNVRFNQIRYGVKFSWGQFLRSHINVGIINEGLSGGDYTNIQRIALDEPYDIDKRFITGFFLEYKKDHSFNFFLNAYSKYPFTGEVDYSYDPDASEDYADGSTFFVIGFHRSLDAFY